MAEGKLALILWACAAVLLLLFGASMRGDGTWMGGIAIGWMMATPLLILGLAVYFAYKYGRMAERVDQKPKP